MSALPLEEIGFYTLSDERARTASEHSPLRRCELLITDACNFRCPYCRGCRPELRGTMRRTEWESVLKFWLADGLRNVRFSGGEPTLHPDLPDMIDTCRSGGVERVAISTNGSAPLATYEALLRAGANDFSVSLDACCAAEGDAMAGGVEGTWDNVVAAIKYLSARTYVTVGVVLTPDNASRLGEIVTFADSLWVADVRVISAAQWNGPLSSAVSPDVLGKHPILKYRMARLSSGQRGLRPGDNYRCPLVLDDMAVAGGWHFPCIIYLREGGRPIGRVGPGMRAERAEWAREHDTHGDEICRRNCLDVCVAYNNRWRELHQQAASAEVSP